MKVLFGDKGNVDFDEQLILSNEKREKFISFIKTVFPIVEIERVNFPRKDRIGDKLFMKEWDEHELAFLFDTTKTTDELSGLLGRTWMSVDIKRGQFLPIFLSYSTEQGIDVTKLNELQLKELIRKFLKENEDLMLKRRKLRSELRRKKKDLIKLEEELITFNSDKRQNELKLLKSLNKITDKEISDVRQNIINKLSEKKKEIEKFEEEHGEI